MSNDTIRTRYDAIFTTDFMPLIRQDQTQGAPERVAYAVEFARFQLGQINKKLGRPDRANGNTTAAPPRG